MRWPLWRQRSHLLLSHYLCQRQCCYKQCRWTGWTPVSQCPSVCAGPQFLVRCWQCRQLRCCLLLHHKNGGAYRPWLFFLNPIGQPGRLFFPFRSWGWCCAMPSQYRRGRRRRKCFCIRSLFQNAWSFWRSWHPLYSRRHAGSYWSAQWKPCRVEHYSMP